MLRARWRERIPFQALSPISNLFYVSATHAISFESTLRESRVQVSRVLRKRDSRKWTCLFHPASRYRPASYQHRINLTIETRYLREYRTEDTDRSSLFSLSSFLLERGEAHRTRGYTITRARARFPMGVFLWFPPQIRTTRPCSSSAPIMVGRALAHISRRVLEIARFRGIRAGPIRTSSSRSERGVTRSANSRRVTSLGVTIERERAAR